MVTSGRAPGRELLAYADHLEQIAASKGPVEIATAPGHTEQIVPTEGERKMWKLLAEEVRKAARAVPQQRGRFRTHANPT